MSASVASLTDRETVTTESYVRHLEPPPEVRSAPPDGGSGRRAPQHFLILLQLVDH